MSRARRWLAGIVVAAAIAFAVFLLWAHRPAIGPIERPAPSSFAPEQVAQGQRLAMVGNCISCHQSAHGAPYAGGYAVRSPFGTIYGSNITPDPDTGIGRWSRAAFVRAMREGVSRDGHLLYPAFPYTHFTHATDSDLTALYAFLMTRAPVRAVPLANRLIPPLGFRPLVAGWNLLFFHPRPASYPSRGAYLGETLAHCGGCHSPRGALGQEKAPAYDGGWVDGWYAPPLNGRSPAVRAWTADRLYTYLTTGLSTSHAAAAGPMGSVAHNLARADPADVRALATYYAGRLARTRDRPALPDREAQARAASPQGAALFAGACAVCHAPGAPMMVAGRPPLPLGSPLHEATARDTIAIILRGLAPPVKPAGPYMPAYADTLTDRQIAQIVGYLHARYGTGPGWPDLDRAVAQARKATQP